MYFKENYFLKDSTNFQHWKMTSKKPKTLRCSRRLFIILVSLTVTLFREKILISNRCRGGFMSNSNKQSLTVSTNHLPPKVGNKSGKNLWHLSQRYSFFLYNKTFLCHILESPITFVWYWKEKGKNNLTSENEGL